MDNILFSIDTLYSKLTENDNNIQIIIELIKMIDPALLIKEFIFFITSFFRCDRLGNLYLGNSIIYEYSSVIWNILHNIYDDNIIINTDTKYMSAGKYLFDEKK